MLRKVLYPSWKKEAVKLKTKKKFTKGNRELNSPLPSVLTSTSSLPDAENLKSVQTKILRFITKKNFQQDSLKSLGPIS